LKGVIHSTNVRFSPLDTWLFLIDKELRSCGCAAEGASIVEKAVEFPAKLLALADEVIE
jgi:hypothetical protein